MATAKMAISSGDSTSMLYTTTKIAGKIYHAITILNRISDESLDTLVGLCAGRIAIVRIQREQSSKLIKRLAATQLPTPVLDDEHWAAEVGGNIVGEVEGHRSHLTPWKDANFGIKFLYRRAADEAVSSQESQYPVYPHDGALYSWLLKSKTSAPCQTFNQVRSSDPSSSKLPRTPLSTPPSKNTPKQGLPTATDSLPLPLPLMLCTPMTPPTSPSARGSTRACDEIADKPNSSQQQVLDKRSKASPPSAALLSRLFSEEQERARNCRKRSGRDRANPKTDAKQNSDDQNRQDTDDDTDSCMGSMEVAAMRRRQTRRLQRKDPAPPAEIEENAPERKRRPTRPQTRSVKAGGAALRPRVQFREREPTRRRAAARAMENIAL